MISIQQLYSIVEEDRNKLLSFFEKVDREHFYDSIVDNVWSPELIFRHLLMSIHLILERLPNGSPEISKLAVGLGENVNNQANLDEVIAEFNIISPTLNERLSLLTHEQEEEEIDMWRGKMQRRTFVVRMINHEHRHLGQMYWLLKRSTGWTDDEMYGTAD